MHSDFCAGPTLHKGLRRLEIVMCLACVWLDLPHMRWDDDVCLLAVGRTCNVHTVHTFKPASIANDLFPPHLPNGSGADLRHVYSTLSEANSHSRALLFAEAVTWLLFFLRTREMASWRSGGGLAKC